MSFRSRLRANNRNEAALRREIAAVLFDAATKNATAHPASAAPMGPETLNPEIIDPEIVGIVVAANQINIDYAKLALSKSKNNHVRDFALQMVTDHSAVQKSVRDLGAKLNVTAAESDTSKALKAQSERTIKHLQVLTGKSFDKAYIDNEVTYHQVGTKAVANVLIPNAQNAELREALTDAQPLFQCHLEHAQIVQAAMNGTAA